MRTSERDLVGQIANGDSAAFSRVLYEQTPMVYATCWRILHDESRAADVVQETFYELFKNAHRITGCLGAWLHRVATRRAIDVIRQDSSRRRREETYSREGAAGDSTWAEVQRLVDEALETLPDEQRELLTLHFLERKTCIQIAAAKGISQPTISRRISEALEALRISLRQQGVTMAVVPLQTLLIHSVAAVPELLQRQLGKMALACSAAGKGAGASFGLATVGKLLAVGAAAGVVVWAVVLRQPPEQPAQNPVKPLVVQSTPAAAAKPQPNAAPKAEIAQPSASDGVRSVPTATTSQAVVEKPNPLVAVKLPVAAPASPTVKSNQPDRKPTTVPGTVPTARPLTAPAQAPQRPAPAPVPYQARPIRPQVRPVIQAPSPVVIVPQATPMFRYNPISDPSRGTRRRPAVAPPNDLGSLQGR
jgi:RNA polymerase sigma factor (sigma-70 family)